MARPPLVLKREQVRLIHPFDSAIDHKATPSAVLEAYAKCEDLDTSKLLMTSEAPTVYVVRGLTDHELNVARSMLGTAEDSRELALRNAAYMVWVLSIGLVSVENLEGWDKTQRVKEHGVEFWDRGMVEALGEDVAWLFKAITTLTKLDDEKKRRSGSSPISPSGTTEGAAKTESDAPDPSTVAGGA